jgi:hypothetical protein
MSKTRGITRKCSSGAQTAVVWSGLASVRLSLRCMFPCDCDLLPASTRVLQGFRTSRILHNGMNVSEYNDWSQRCYVLCEHQFFDDATPESGVL